MIKNMSCSFLTKFIIVMPCDLGHQGLDWALVYVPEVTPNHIRRSWPWLQRLLWAASIGRKDDLQFSQVSSSGSLMFIREYQPLFQLDWLLELPFLHKPKAWKNDTLHTSQEAQPWAFGLSRHIRSLGEENNICGEIPERHAIHSVFKINYSQTFSASPHM